MEWRDFKLEQPEDNKTVIIFSSSGIRTGYINKGEWYNHSDSCGCCDTFDDNVTQWMSVEPPKLQP